MAAPVGPPTAMSRLLSQARLSSFHPSISQIYSAPASHQSRGDFGLKRTLPTSDLRPGSVRYVAVDELDTQDGQTPWRERERDVLVLKRWHEAGARLSVPNSNSKDAEIPAGGLGIMPRSSYDRSTHLPLPNAKSRAAARAVAAASSSTLQPATMADAYGPAKHAYKEAMHSTPDYLSLTDAQFEAFLRDLRSARPDHRRWVTSRNLGQAKSLYLIQLEKKRQKALEANQRAMATGATPVEVPRAVTIDEIPAPPLEEAAKATDMWGEARSTSMDAALLDKWIREREHRSASNPKDRTLPISKSREIQALQVRPPHSPLHAHAGIQYSQPDRIYTQLLAEPIPGRVINSAPTGNNVSSAGSYAARTKSADDKDIYATATGGRFSLLAKSSSNGVDIVDFSRRNTSKGVASFRIVDAMREESLRSGPNGNPVDSMATERDLGYIGSRIRASAEDDSVRAAKGYPGSAAWVGQLDHRPVLASAAAAASGGGSKGRVKSLYSQGEQSRARHRGVQARTPLAGGAAKSENQAQNNRIFARLKRLDETRGAQKSSS